LGRVAEPVLYLPVTSVLDKEIVVRTTAPPAKLASAMTEWAREIDPQLAIRSQRFDERIATELLPGRLVAAATGALGALALLLAAIGISGVVSFAVGQRRHELAVRMAIGATARDVIALVMRQGGRPLLIGAGTGITLAAIVAQLVHKVLYGVSPLDPVAYLSILMLLGGAGLIATYIPSRRAALIDPASTLRDEA